MKYIQILFIMGFLLIGCSKPESPAVTSGKINYPAGYRDWSHIKSMVLQDGHALFNAFGGIHHIYANEKAKMVLQKGGVYPDGSVIVFDLLEAKSENSAVTEGARKVVGVMVKDSKAFGDTEGWGFEGFKADSQERVVTNAKESCFGCHISQKDKDYVFSTYRK